MRARKVLRSVLIIALIAVNIGCDQVSKSIIRDRVSIDTNLRYLNGHFLITRAENTGAFLSLGDNTTGPLRIVFLSLIPALLLIFSISYLIRNKNVPAVTLIGICFIVGGGIGNIFDRIVHGSVTDFLYLDYHPFHTGIFNLADVSITVGALLILIGINLKNPPRFLAGRKQETVTADSLSE
ncbi:signal peptidase II [Mucilaginibacter ginkgonis]|uniref:Lipoprotein signal peptidase n=1 Tax=Mucilaginibacter ginkgonis TaxID=2682091 RepID=A0A6I4INE6_9SPHI|nr:signal peptidase II [Mucilaginibacter ginkgonis]QQL49756.1 signal peptidase II [Mucilaginibacter ginkgonis]